MTTDEYPFSVSQLWRRGNPPPDGELTWRIGELWFARSEFDQGKLGHVFIHALVEPGAPPRRP